MGLREIGLGNKRKGQGTPTRDNRRETPLSLKFFSSWNNGKNQEKKGMN